MMDNELVSKAGRVASLFDLAGKAALVTGGAKGLGEAVALALAGAGADVVIAGKTAANNERTAAEIRAMGRRSLSVTVDVRDAAQVQRMVSAVVDELGRLDILVNSAGVAETRPITEFPLDVWETIMDINVKGTFLCAREAAKQMLRQGKGKIINISSLQGSAGRAGDPAYAPSKAAVDMLTRSMACEWAARGICVNAIAPTWCWTEMTSRALGHAEFYARIKERVPAGRAGRREDLFGIAVFLASDASDFVNGAIIPLDGGAIASDGFPLVPLD